MNGFGPEEPYWEALLDGELKLPKCDTCEKWHWPAVFRCGDCGSWEHTWMQQALNGTVYSWTRTWQDFGAPQELEPPFISVLVEVAGSNIRLLGLFNEGQEPTIGQTVEGQIVKISFQDRQIPVIRWHRTEDRDANQ